MAADHKAVPDLPEGGTPTGEWLLKFVDHEGNSVHKSLADIAQWIKTAESIVPESEPFRGALAYRSAILSIDSNTSTTISWSTTLYDTDSIWSAGAPTRLTVPAGVSKVRLKSLVGFPSASYSNLSVSIIKNGDSGALEYPGQGGNRLAVSGTAPSRIEANTAVLSVVGGTDYFECRVIQTSAASRDLQINSWFSMELVEVHPE